MWPDLRRSSLAYTVGVASLNGFADDVALSLTGLPPGVGTANFSPQIFTPDGEHHGHGYRCTSANRQDPPVHRNKSPRALGDACSKGRRHTANSSPAEAASALSWDFWSSVQVVGRLRCVEIIAVTLPSLASTGTDATA
jgi:hypothetical protein